MATAGSTPVRRKGSCVPPLYRRRGGCSAHGAGGSDHTGVVFGTNDSGADGEDGAAARADGGVGSMGAGGMEGGEAGVGALEDEGEGLLEFARRGVHRGREGHVTLRTRTIVL